MSFTKCILGDNQFLGVNHSNQAKASLLYEKFKNPDSIIELLGIAYEGGIRDFMFTTHDRYEVVFEEIRRSDLFPGLHFSPCIPYAHKYWNKISQVGFGGLLSSLVLQVNPFSVIKEFPKSLLFKNNYIIKLLLDIELLMCKGMPIRGVFLQNLAFDMMISMGLLNFISSFNEIVTNRLGVIPGFITMNHPLALKTLCTDIGIHKPWICANYNLTGFRMNPSQADCESSFSSRKSNNIAMSVMSSGEYSPEESLNYVAKNLTDGSVNSILFGSSKKKNIQNNFKAINNYSAI